MKKALKNFHCARPFLKWAGGKTQLLGELDKRLPEEIQTGEITRYAEPFIGGGAFFLSLSQKYSFEQCMICDANEELILTYKVIKKSVKQLIKNLETIESEYLSKDEKDRELMYYKIRDDFNRKLSEINFRRFNSEWIVRAAWIIFLNHTCYNGLFRVNRKGEFNVPFGKYKNPEICKENNLNDTSSLLKTTRIVSGDFSCCRRFVDDTSFVYLDPPYRPINQTSSFTSYSKEGFFDSDQVRLVNFFKEIDKKGAKIMLSNSDPQNHNPSDSFFDDHFSDYTIERVPAKRTINSVGAGRGKINELIITNYR
ncbi:MAG: DNA adenine methylase [Methanoregula sp.]|nr:DNA adenine methylase [Methanoregula sp.]